MTCIALFRRLVSRAGAALARETISVANALKDPRVRRLLLTLIICVFVLSLVDHSVLAQSSTDGGKVTSTLKNLTSTIYFQWRIPISILGLFGAAVAFFSTSPHGKAWALRIFVGVVIWALIPTFIDLISSWTGTTGNGNITGT
jgi:hypothetical protein